nr:MAG TPA: hypothetical protein [Caudoviricetes sp.]
MTNLLSEMTLQPRSFLTICGSSNATVEIDSA